MNKEDLDESNNLARKSDLAKDIIDDNKSRQSNATQLTMWGNQPEDFKMFLEAVNDDLFDH